ncbi:glycosyltransferase family protein [Arthrobacter sp. KNU-44]|uniref:glycosyltransferase family protein n=1 Tax=unclassified Arthrobacter TaxID=235627 RepID=UPI003F424BC0
MVHLYDYVANDISLLLNSCGDHPGLLIFASSAARRNELLERFPELSEKIRVSAPPVCSRLWKSNHLGGKPKYDLVHIGNYKPYYSESRDEYASRFLKLVQLGRVHVWGAGWEDRLDGEYCHGRLGISKVSEIYAKSRVALGMMYPNQRTVSLSGRFWHAPLNGCHIISEPSVFADDLPGVLSSEYIDAPNPHDFSEASRVRLQSHAVRYWDDAFQALKTVIENHMGSFPPGQARPTIKFFGAYIITLAKKVRWAFS